MQGGQNQLEGGLSMGGMEVHWDASPVVLNGDGATVSVQGDPDDVRMAVDYFIDGVVYDFPNEVVQAR
jgi:hypothetical protein